MSKSVYIVGGTVAGVIVGYFIADRGEAFSIRPYDTGGALANLLVGWLAGITGGLVGAAAGGFLGASLHSLITQ